MENSIDGFYSVQANALCCQAAVLAERDLFNPNVLVATYIRFQLIDIKNKDISLDL